MISLSQPLITVRNIERPIDGNNITVVVPPGEPATNVIVGSGILVGTPEPDIIIGGPGPDHLIGGGGRDHLIGGPGSDILEALAGSRTLASWIDAERSVSANYVTGFVTTGSDTDTVIRIRDFRGSNLDDNFVGNNSNNEIIATRGFDQIDGGGGLNNTINYRLFTTGVSVDLHRQMYERSEDIDRGTYENISRQIGTLHNDVWRYSDDGSPVSVVRQSIDGNGGFNNSFIANLEPAALARKIELTPELLSWKVAFKAGNGDVISEVLGSRIQQLEFQAERLAEGTTFVMNGNFSTEDFIATPVKFTGNMSSPNDILESIGDPSADFFQAALSENPGDPAVTVRNGMTLQQNAHLMDVDGIEFTGTNPAGATFDMALGLVNRGITEFKVEDVGEEASTSVFRGDQTLNAYALTQYLNDPDVSSLQANGDLGESITAFTKGITRTELLDIESTFLAETNFAQRQQGMPMKTVLITAKQGSNSTAILVAKEGDNFFGFGVGLVVGSVSVGVDDGLGGKTPLGVEFRGGFAEYVLEADLEQATMFNIDQDAQLFASKPAVIKLWGSAQTDRAAIEAPTAATVINISPSDVNPAVLVVVSSDGVDPLHDRVVEGRDIEEWAVTSKGIGTNIFVKGDLAGAGVSKATMPLKGDGGDNKIDASEVTSDTTIIIEGFGGDDILTGGPGDDIINGGDDNDIIEGRAGADTLAGGQGIDTLSYASDTVGVTVDLTTQTATGPGSHADGDTISGFENVIGGSGDDTLIFTVSEQDPLVAIFYDGGSGFDTLRLDLTDAEKEAILLEIEPGGANEATILSGGTYVFSNLNLTVSNFEALEIVGVAAIVGELKVLLASDRSLADNFGFSVGIDGDTAIVGARNDDRVGQGIRDDSGSAYVFERQVVDGSDAWVEIVKLTASDAAADDKFGSAVSIDGDTAIVGAPRDDDGGLDSGSVYVFERDLAGDWSEVLKLTASDADVADRFGDVVSISGDTAIVGAFLNDNVDAGSNSGSAYIFERDMAGDWDEVSILTASDADAFDFFGFSVSIDGDTAIVGEPGSDDGGTNFGAAYIFERDMAGDWGEVLKLTASQGGSGVGFGDSVSINGDLAIVGARLDLNAGINSGSAYIFERNIDTGVWEEIARLKASDPGGNHRFGDSVSIDGDIAIVGSEQHDDKGTASGSAYVFERQVVDGSDVWVEIDKLLDPNGSTGDRFGGAVDLDGDAGVGIVGAEVGGLGNEGIAFSFDII